MPRYEVIVEADGEDCIIPIPTAVMELAGTKIGDFAGEGERQEIKCGFAGCV